jgi:hypothetical protein
VPLRRLLACAERLSESAIFRGSFDRNTFGSRSSALLRCVTRADQRFLEAFVFAGIRRSVRIRVGN